MKRYLAILGRSALAGVVFAMTFCAGVALVATVVTRSFMVPGEPADDGEVAPYVESWHAGVADESAPKVVRIDISGEIGAPAPSPFDDLLGGVLVEEKGADMAKEARKRIQFAQEDESVKGLYLVFDTPGGDLTDSDLFWHDIKCFREAQPGRFVFAHVLSQCCSGGYYVASASDFIMVLPTSVVGSIGVISDYGYNVAGLAGRFGVTNVVVSTGVHKDAFNPTRPVDARQVAIEQALIDKQFDRFVQIVAEGRKMSVEKVRALADGRVFVASDAVEKGLVDAVGYPDEALEILDKLAGGKVHVIEYERSPEVEPSLIGKLFGGKHYVLHQRSARRRRGLPVPRLRLVR